MRFKLGLFALTLFVALNLINPKKSNAQLIGENCPTQQTISGQYMINKFFTLSWGCLVQVTPINKSTMIYREYVFDEGGRFLVFNSTPGQYETSTGMRVFYLFPKIGLPEVKIVGSKIEITTSSGLKVVIPNQSSFIESISGLEFSDNQKIELSSSGGFEIKSYPHIYLDTGWKVGGQAYRDPLGKSVFVDAKNQRCEVNNFEIFIYDELQSPEPYMFYQSNEAVYGFLSLRCPNLTLQ